MTPVGAQAIKSRESIVITKPPFWSAGPEMKEPAVFFNAGSSGVAELTLFATASMEDGIKRWQITRVHARSSSHWYWDPVYRPAGAVVNGKIEKLWIRVLDLGITN